MKLAIAGGSYKNANLAAAAQTCLNYYPERIEDPNGSGKGAAFLQGAPGYHLLVNLNAHIGSVRGIWSGGGRCFVCVGAWVYEIDNTGAIVGSPTSLTFNDTLPVQFFGNGTQLGMIAGGVVVGGINQRYFYINNGVGFEAARFQISGVVTVIGTAVTWVSGQQFPAVFPTVMKISDIAVAVASRNTATSVTLVGAFPGSGSGTVRTYLQQVYWTSGDLFTTAMEGNPITINSVDYTVRVVPVEGNGYILTLIDSDDAGQQIGAAYSAVQTNLVYSAAAGDLVTAQTGAYLDSQFYVSRIKSAAYPALGRQVNFSAVGDGTSWSGLDFFSKESAADDIASILAHNKQLIVWGQQYEAEVWQNDPNTGRPVLISGMVFQQPSACRYAPVTLDDRAYFVGGPLNGGMVAYRVDGSVPTRISTHAIEQQWKVSGTAPSAVVGWPYEDDGHYFWVVCFADRAWVYDVTEKFWHERQQWTGTALAPYRFWFHTYIPEWTANSAALQGLHIVGDYSSGKVFIMSTTYFDEEGVNMRRQRALPYLFQGGKRVFVGRVQLTQAAGATVNLDWSEDDGANFSTPEAGSDTTTTPYWIAQGSFPHSAIPRLTVTGQVQSQIIDCDAEVDYGTS